MLLSATVPFTFRIHVSHQTQEPPSEFLPAKPGIQRGASWRNVDYDPLVLVHARALLTGTPQGVTEYIDADLRNPAAILEAANRTTLDLSQPTGLILMNILGHVPDLDEAVAIVGHLR